MKNLILVAFVFASCSVLLSKARVSSLYECPPGFVGVGYCSFPFGHCDVGFCYHRHMAIPENGEPGVCCVKPGYYSRRV